MSFKTFTLLVLFVSVPSISACSFTVTLPDVTPVVVVQSANTPVVPVSTSGPTTVPSSVPTLASTLVPTFVPTLSAATQAPNSCSANWFFTFDAQHQSLGSYCPEQVKLLSAVGQDFEGGRVYRYAADPAYPADQRGTIYVIYNDGEWITFPDAWDSTQPSFDPDQLVPTDRYQPVDGIGKVWREFPEVRQRLGWAYQPQASFQGRFQSYSLIPNPPPNGANYYFIDHGEWNLVLLLNSVDMGPNTWEIVGKY